MQFLHISDTYKKLHVKWHTLDTNGHVVLHIDSTQLPQAMETWDTLQLVLVRTTSYDFLMRAM